MHAYLQPTKSDDWIVTELLSDTETPNCSIASILQFLIVAQEPLLTMMPDILDSLKLHFLINATDDWQIAIGGKVVDLKDVDETITVEPADALIPFPLQLTNDDFLITARVFSK